MRWPGIFRNAPSFLATFGDNLEGDVNGYYAGNV
jgi:hypothetical protein